MSAFPLPFDGLSLRCMRKHGDAVWDSTVPPAKLESIAAFRAFIAKYGKHAGIPCGIFYCIVMGFAVTAFVGCGTLWEVEECKIQADEKRWTQSSQSHVCVVANA